MGPTAAAGAQATDVLIVGGGPAGAATARAVARAGPARVLLVDDAAGPRVGGGEWITESAAPGVSAHLARLGLRGDLAAFGLAPCQGSISVWGGSVPVEEDFLTSPRGGPAWHVDRRLFDAWLLDAAEASGVRTLSPARLVDVAAGDDGGWRAVVAFGPDDRTTTVRARIVVDATGRRAAVARRLGARRRRVDDLVALSLRAPRPARLGFEGRSLVVAAEHGWWFAAELPGRSEVGVAFSSDADVVASLGLRAPHALAARWRATPALADSIAPPDGPRAASTAGDLRVRAAGSGFLDRAAGAGWLAVGDAVVAFDPLTSSGLSGALEDAWAAAETIRAWLEARNAAEVDAAGRAYARRANATLLRYLAERARVYGRERRWPDSPFWSRRAPRESIACGADG